MFNGFSGNWFYVRKSEEKILMDIGGFEKF